MKLYTYTMKRSLPRMALKGMPDGFYFREDPEWFIERAGMNEIPGEVPVILEVETDGIEHLFGLAGEDVEDVATSAQEDVEGGEGDGQSAYEKVYERAEEIANTLTGEPWIRAMLEEFGGTTNLFPVPADRITVLGKGDVKWSDGFEDAKVTFDAAPKPLTSFKQPLVTRLLRSIFLPKHKLYGAGSSRRPSMGFLSKFFPRAEDVDAPPPDVVSGVPLVWAAGKTFQRGMNGAFGTEAGGAIGKLVALRLGAAPGKLLGSGAKGAAYMFGPSQVVKVTMDGTELQAAAHLRGVRHPNLATVHDVFIVSDGEKGAGVILRDAVDTTLSKYNPKAAKQVDVVMDEVLASAQQAIGDEVGRIQDINPKILSEQVDGMIEWLREEGCETDTAEILLDLADAFRMLAHYGILGIDFDAQNVGVIKKPSPRPVLFDYGMTQSPPIDVEVINLKNVEV